jgi:hypothetical protein
MEVEPIVISIEIKNNFLYRHGVKGGMIYKLNFHLSY